MAKFLANILLLIFLIGIQVGTMIYGWGLVPRNWWWIVGMGFFGNVTVMLFSKAMDKDKP